MAIPIQFQQFKAAGVYRVVYDRSTVLGQPAELLRLVVGYSPKGPFNTPVYISSVSDFKATFGDISKSLEKRGCFFHRTAIHALASGPVLCLNLKKFADETVDVASVTATGNEVDGINVPKIFDTTRFWKLEPNKLNELEDDCYIHIATIDSKENSGSFAIRKAVGSKVSAYDITVNDWYKDGGDDIPDYLIGLEDKKISDFFVEIYTFKGEFVADQVVASETLGKYFEVDDYDGLIIKDFVTNAYGDHLDALDLLAADPTSGCTGHYIGCTLPYFVDKINGYKSLDILFNVDSDTHHMMMSFKTDMLEEEGSAADILADYLVPTPINVEDDVDDYSEESPALKMTYLEGYEYAHSKPEGTSMHAKVEWQKYIMSALYSKEMKGLHDALLSSAEIEFRYVIDSFESYISADLKWELAKLAKEKELCFAILNFPSVQTFIKSTNPKFVDDKGMFNVRYVAEGGKKGTGSFKFTLPTDVDGASFCAFYTPLKFSDGYIDAIIPSAGLVSNFFLSKHNDRYPYSIIAGPNYSNIEYAGLVGPDYHYTPDELQYIEPFGVNCMIYRPGFGTFINANQTAKQSPKSALSSVNVRELVIYLQDEIGKILQANQWEFNNADVRSKIKNAADLICKRTKATGGIIDYLNVIDESNNTGEIIDNEMCVLSTHIEAGRGAGKMIHELTLYRTGMMRSTIKGA